MYRKLICVAILPLLLTTCGCLGGLLNTGIQGSGISKTEIREVGGFTSVSYAGVGDLVIVVGGEQKVEVTFDDNLLELVETTVRGGVLEIDTKGSYTSNVGNKIVVTMPSLQECAITGVGSARVSGLDGGSSQFNVSGVGSITATGRADTLKVNCSGVGSANLGGLEAKSVTVSISGVGGAEVFATDSVVAECSGVGGVTVLGNPPNVTKSSSGIGSIEVRK